MIFGIDGVDRELEDGLDSPQLLTFEVDSNTDYRKVIYNMIDHEEDKEKFIISTQNSTPVINSKLEQSNYIDESNVIVIDMQSEDLDISTMKDRLEKIPQNAVVYIESLPSVCEKIPNSTHKIINTLYELISQRSLFIIAWVQRNTTIADTTIQNADTNIQIRLENEIGYEVSKYLIFTKLLNRQEITSQFKLQLYKSSVEVDTSRNVA